MIYVLISLLHNQTQSEGGRMPASSVVIIWLWNWHLWYNFCSTSWGPKASTVSSPSVAGQFQQSCQFFYLGWCFKYKPIVDQYKVLERTEEYVCFGMYVKLHLLVCHLLILLLNHTEFPFKVLGSWIRFFPIWNLLLLLAVPKAADITELIIVIRVKNCSFSHWNVLALILARSILQS